MHHKGTRLEIDMNALEHNYRYLKSLLQPETLFLSVIKANAYGHGMIPIAKKLQELGTDYFAVAYVEEGVELRDNGITKPILVLHPQEHTLETCIDRCLEPVIYSVPLLEAFSAFAKAKNQQSYPIHIEFNTGLNRIGIDPDELEQTIAIIKASPALKIRGLQSHLAASEDAAENDFTQSQLTIFEKISKEITNHFNYPIIHHTSNTSGALNFNEAHYNMVRCGIGLYGYGNDPEHDKHLVPVASLYSVISQVRSIEAGESVSYNRKFIATKPMTYAVIALGHGDGIARIYGHGKGSVMIHGKIAHTLGIICMDMFMVDVTDIPCAPGDEVKLFGKKHTASMFAETANTISYELLTHMQQRLKRIYV